MSGRRVRAARDTFAAARALLAAASWRVRCTPPGAEPVRFAAFRYASPGEAERAAQRRSLSRCEDCGYVAPEMACDVRLDAPHTYEPLFAGEVP